MLTTALPNPKKHFPSCLLMCKAASLGEVGPAHYSWHCVSSFPLTPSLLSNRLSCSVGI